MKTLIIRLSSFGDILQAQPCIDALYKKSTETQTKTQIDWLIRSDFSQLLKDQPLHKTFSLPRRSGFVSLVKMIWLLANEKYTHIYDAHNNLRSFWIRTLLPPLSLLRCGVWPKLAVRSKNRWKRFLFFKLHRPVFKMPFRGSESFLEPLAVFGCSTQFSQKAHFHIKEDIPNHLPKEFIVLAPSAAWPTKRWPLPYWQELVQRLPKMNFVVLGGSEDTFCQDLANVFPDRVFNLAGHLSLSQSCAVVQKARLVISGDTGILHAADQMRKPNLGLIGPTAFGYTSQDTSQIIETQLWCKPCSKDGRDPCKNKIFQKCLIEIKPQLVAEAALKMWEIYK